MPPNASKDRRIQQKEVIITEKTRHPAIIQLGNQARSRQSIREVLTHLVLVLTKFAYLLAFEESANKNIQTPAVRINSVVSSMCITANRGASRHLLISALGLGTRRAQIGKDWTM